MSNLVSRLFPLAVAMAVVACPTSGGDARFQQTLVGANIGKAKAIPATTDDDLANIEAALDAREINPGVRVVLRLFDDTLEKLAQVEKMNRRG